MKVYRLFILTTILLLTSISFGQSIDIETEKFMGIKKLIVKSFNGCCAQKGFRAIYYFDNNGRTIKSSNYFKRQLLASYEYRYNDKGFLIEKNQTFDINNKNRKDTTKFDYTLDANGRVITKAINFGKWTAKDMYSDFDTLNYAQTVIHTFDNNKGVVEKRQFNSKGREVFNQQLKNDTISMTEESKYNDYGDKVYSNIPELLDKETGKMVILIGGSRHSIIEVYEYSYDKLNRWTKKYVVFDNKKVLLEKRIYR